MNTSMEETEPAISDHSPERTEGGKDKPNEKEAENGGQEKEGNENEEDKTDTNKDDDQEEEEEEDNGDEEEEEGDANENGDQQGEEEDGDQEEEEEEDEGGNELEEEGEDEADTNKDGDQEEEEEADEGPLKASSTPKKRKRNGEPKVLKSAPSKKRRKNYTSHQQKEEEDPAEVLNAWKRKLVPGLPTAKPIPLVPWEEEPCKEWQEERVNTEVVDNLDNFVATKNMTVRAAFALGRALEAAFRQNRRKGTWAKWVATHLKGNMSESYAFKLRDLYNTLGPYPLFQYLCIPVSKMIRCRGKIQAYLQKDLALAAFWQADDVQVQ